jgi:aerobic carbon-monoxide dehydrogenase large subunit
MRTNRYIGNPVERLVDLRFLRGRGEYVGDIRRPGMLHAAILRSPIAHGRIPALDPAPALSIRGVRRVVAAAEIARELGAVPRIPLRLQTSPATEPFRQPVIADGRVRYVGEPLAIVLADSPAQAEDGIEAIRLDLDELPVVADRHVSGRATRCCSPKPAAISR